MCNRSKIYFWLYIAVESYYHQQHISSSSTYIKAKADNLGHINTLVEPRSQSQALL